MSVRGNTQGGHGLGETYLDFGLLGVPVPDTDESFIILLCEELLRVSVIGDVRHDCDLIAVFV